MRTTAEQTGANVRAEMARAGMTQARLGELLSLHQSAVSMRLSGKKAFDVNELAAVAAALDVDVDVLIKAPAARAS